MISSGVFISAEDWRAMPPDLREQLHDWLSGTGQKVAPPEAPSAKAPGDAPAASDDDEDELPDDLSPAQAKNLLRGCSDKTKSVLRAVFSKDQPTFTLGELAQELNTDKSALSGVWSGITKRTRTVLGDKDAGLFVWDWDEARDDWNVSSSDMTYQSMRKALGIV